MYIVIAIFLVLILAIFGFSFTKGGKNFFDFLAFFAKGKDKGFSTSNLFLLWRTATFVGLNEKTKLFWSISAFDDCIAFIARQVESPINAETKIKMQSVLNKLYKYRTKIELEKSEKKRALESTREIFMSQICIILVPNETTIYAKVVANTKQNIVLALFDASFERAKNIIWKDKFIRVYFWKAKDAGYIFPSTVINHKKYEDRLELFITHSNKLMRTQKRKSIRATCNFEALMFPMTQTTPYNSEYENEGGVKCIVNDISEDGAMFFVKGKAANGVKMKLQFKIRNIPVVMCGKIVRFMYNKPMNKSRVHFQCELLDQKSKNTILGYVYNISSEDNSEFISTLFDDIDDTNFDFEANNYNSEEFIKHTDENIDNNQKNGEF